MLRFNRKGKGILLAVVKAFAQAEVQGGSNMTGTDCV
jgi:hypothetical protein